MGRDKRTLLRPGAHDFDDMNDPPFHLDWLRLGIPSSPSLRRAIALCCQRQPEDAGKNNVANLALPSPFKQFSASSLDGRPLGDWRIPPPRAGQEITRSSDMLP